MQFRPRGARVLLFRPAWTEDGKPARAVPLGYLALPAGELDSRAAESLDQPEREAVAAWMARYRARQAGKAADEYAEAPAMLARLAAWVQEADDESVREHALALRRAMKRLNRAIEQRIGHAAPAGDAADEGADGDGG